MCWACPRRRVCAKGEGVGLWFQRQVVALQLSLALLLLMALTWLDRSVRPKLPFPRDPDQLRANQPWLVDTLRVAGALPAHAVISAVHVAPYKTAEAFRSRVARVRIQHQVAGGNPETLALIAKFAPPAHSLRDHAVYILQQNHIKEVAVYAHLVSDDDVAAPAAWFAECRALSGHFCILMEDLHSAVEVTELAGCPVELAELAMDAFAALHGRFWGCTGASADFLKYVPDPIIDHFAAEFPGADGPLFGELVRRVWRLDSQAPGTALHGDARVGNMLFPGPSEDRFAFIDWQAARLGKGAFDVAYFLVLSTTPEVRRSHGQALLARYHAELQRRGVRDYSLDDLSRDYRLATVLVMGFVSLPMMSAESSDTGANAAGLKVLADVWTRRIVALVDDLDIAWIAEQVGMDGAVLQAAFERSNAATRAGLASPEPGAE